MGDLIKRIVLSCFPELGSGYHLPMLGRVEAVSNPPVSGATCTQADPRYAVSIQPLDNQLQPRGEVLQDLVLSVPWAGQQRGFFALPDPGCIVEFCFAYGLPNLIQVRGVIPWGLELPPLDVGASRWQAGPDAYSACDAAGHWTQEADSLESRARSSQALRSPKTWIGSDQENLLAIVSELAEAVADTLDVLATHTHAGPGTPPDQAANVTAQSQALQAIKSRLDAITAS